MKRRPCRSHRLLKSLRKPCAPPPPLMMFAQHHHLFLPRRNGWKGTRFPTDKPPAPSLLRSHFQPMSFLMTISLQLNNRNIRSPSTLLLSQQLQQWEPSRQLQTRHLGEEKALQRHPPTHAATVVVLLRQLPAAAQLLLHLLGLTRACFGAALTMVMMIATAKEKNLVQPTMVLVLIASVCAQSPQMQSIARYHHRRSGIAPPSRGPAIPKPHCFGSVATVKTM